MQLVRTTVAEEGFAALYKGLVKVHSLTICNFKARIVHETCSSLWERGHLIPYNFFWRISMILIFA